MRSDEDIEFYRDREQAAIAMSNVTAEPALRGIHLAMSQCFANLATSNGFHPGGDNSASEEHSGKVV